MAKIDEKMQMIGTAVVLQAQQERATIIEEANRARESEIAAYKDQLMEELFGDIQRRTRLIRQKTVGAGAQAEQKARRELFLRRVELTESVFGAVREKLSAYAAAEKYRSALLEEISALRDRYDHTSTTVTLRGADMALAERIEKLLPGCRVESAKTIRIGGFRLRNEAAGVLIDETLDQRLEDQRPWFLENCGLKTV